MELMEVDNTNESSESTHKINGKDIHLPPVAPDSSGEGLPYAPIDWPKPGDNWRWKVGKRVALNGHYLDRYLYAPKHLCRRDNLSNKSRGFASKLSVQRYIQETFPNADVGAFFASFSWKIPSAKPSSVNGKVEGRNLFPAPYEEIDEHSGSDSQFEGLCCKAGNKMCSSLVVKAENPALTAMPCDICCSNTRFCRDCCCILCDKTVKLNYGGYSYIKCEARVGEGYICGHVAHLNCALRCFMAGTVGGCIGLDAEYCCRRCDAKTDLISHVTRFPQICESVDSQNDVRKILDVGVCILRGSQKNSAKGWLNRIELAIEKLKRRTPLQDLWKVEDRDLAVSTGAARDENAVPKDTNHKDPPKTKTSSQPFMTISSDYRLESRKIEEEIERVLQTLRMSQEFEYKIAEERLYAQKDFLDNLYQQLDKERSQLACRTSKFDSDVLLNAILNRVDQIKQEIKVLKDMEEVANGFGRTSKTILNEYFDLDVEE